MSKAIVTARASKPAGKGKMRRVSYTPATEGPGGTVECDNDGDEPGQYMPSTSSAHESAESAYAKMGEHMGIAAKKKK